MFRKEKNPAEWKQFYISPVYEKGWETDPKYYRGFAAIPTIIFRTVFQSIAKFDRYGQPGEEAFNPEDHARKKVHRIRKTDVTLIDIGKAYDNVPISQLRYFISKLQYNINAH